MSRSLQPDASLYCHHVLFSSLDLCKLFSILVSRASFWVVDVKRARTMQHTQKEYLCAHTIWCIYTQLEQNKNLLTIRAFWAGYCIKAWFLFLFKS